MLSPIRQKDIFAYFKQKKILDISAFFFWHFLLTLFSWLQANYFKLTGISYIFMSGISETDRNYFLYWMVFPISLCLPIGFFNLARIQWYNMTDQIVTAYFSKFFQMQLKFTTTARRWSFKFVRKNLGKSIQRQQKIIGNVSRKNNLHGTKNNITEFQY